MEVGRRAAARALLAAQPGAGPLAGAPLGDLDDGTARAQRADRFRSNASTAGTAIGALIGAYLGNPMLGAQIGGAAGSLGGGLVAPPSGAGGAAPSSAQADIYQLIRAAYQASGKSAKGAS